MKLLFELVASLLGDVDRSDCIFILNLYAWQLLFNTMKAFQQTLHNNPD